MVCENGNFFADSEERHVQKKFLCVKKDLSEVRKVSANENFLIRDKGIFFRACKANRKRKAFFSAQRHQLSTAPKLTCNCKFNPRKPTVSLQYNNPFSKNISLASALRKPFRTDSKPFRRRFAGKAGFGRSRRKFLQSYFRQSFESRSQDGVPRAFWLLFARCKK